MEILRDPLWQFVGAAIALVSLGVAVVIYWHQQRRKELSFITSVFTSLLSVNPEVVREIHIKYRDQVVTNLYLATVQIVNTGQIPILHSEFDRILQIQFGENAHILSAEIIQEKPKNLGANLLNMERCIIIDPVLLNPGDWIAIKALVTGAQKPLVVGRIAGVSDIKELLPDTVLYQRNKIWNVLAVFMVISITGIMISLPPGQSALGIVIFIGSVLFTNWLKEKLLVTPSKLWKVD